MISSGRLPKSHVQVQSLWKMFKLPEQGISWVWHQRPWSSLNCSEGALLLSWVMAEAW